MGAITVRKIDDDLIRELRISAAQRGVSMEQEARDRLRQPLPRLEASPTEEAGAPKWRLKATKEELLALGKGLPDTDFDLKQFTDDMYAYLEEE